MTKATTRTDEGAQGPAVTTTETPTVEAEQPTVAEGGTYLDALSVPEDYSGEATFSRPGVEARTFTVKDGRIRASEEEADWLIDNGVARYPAAAE